MLRSSVLSAVLRRRLGRERPESLDVVELDVEAGVVLVEVGMEEVVGTALEMALKPREEER